jgi:hypothetical protein
MNIEPNTSTAARLIYTAMQQSESPASNQNYRKMLALFRANSDFADMVTDICVGLELVILDVSERGLILAPESASSKFALRLADIRVNRSPEQRAALVLAHLAVAAAFFPTTDQLDDEAYNPPPVTIAVCRDALFALARRLKESNELADEIPKELISGFELVSSLPVVMPDGQRASTNSIAGIVSLALTNMRQYGLIRLDRQAEDESESGYTATHRLRVQIRELTLTKLYAIAQQAANESSKA